MNQKALVYLGKLLLIMTTSTGCGLINGSPKKPVSLIQQSSPTLSAAITTQTSTVTPILTRTNTHTPTLTSILTVPPTLSQEAARIRLLEFLSDNGDCKLPCLWGISPGKNTLSEAIAIISPLSSISGDTIIDRDGLLLWPQYKEGDHVIIYTSISMWTSGNNKYIDTIHFTAQSETEPSKLAFYMLPAILSTNGRPSKVLIYADSVTKGYFDLIIMYPDQGILARYETGSRISGNIILGCVPNDTVDIYLFPPGEDEFSFHINTNAWKSILQKYKLLDEVSSMTLDEFYQITAGRRIDVLSRVLSNGQRQNGRARHFGAQPAAAADLAKAQRENVGLRFWISC